MEFELITIAAIKFGMGVLLHHHNNLAQTCTDLLNLRQGLLCFQTTFFDIKGLKDKSVWSI